MSDARQFAFNRLRCLRDSRTSTLFGFGTSIVVLGVASFLAVPSMIAASGAAAWGAIALGQAIGAVAGVIVGYGWGWFGPARVAQSSASDRRSEYLESVIVRLIFVFPISVIAGGVAYALAPDARWFAVAGAIYSTSVGLSAAWYFVGRAIPFTMLWLDTLPRASATVISIFYMRAGYSAIVGPICMLVGMILAFLMSTVWIVLETRRAGALPKKLRSIPEIFLSNRHGMASALSSISYNSAPLALVSALAPGIQPAFALIDRIRSQVFLVATPTISVLQGWVPRGTVSEQIERAERALLYGFLLAVLLGVGSAGLSPWIIGWLGSGQIRLSATTTWLMSAWVSIMYFESVLARVALATFQQLRVATWAIVGGALVGLPAAGIASVTLGTAGAVGGVLMGSCVCVLIELTGFSVFRRRERAAAVGHSTL